MQKIYLLLLSFFLSVQLNAQDSPRDSLTTQNKINLKSLAAPAALITYGVVGLNNKPLQSFNEKVNKEVDEHILKKTSIDDYMQYSPMLTVYGLNSIGVRGKNNLRHRTRNLALSYIIMGITVTSLKRSTKILRPDGKSSNSFPSGHTATAFMGAEYLWQEYKDVSVWYGIAGYIVAAGTGLGRIYNDRHWVTDVAAGAGIGILSTKVAYWIAPHFRKNQEKKKPAKAQQTLVYPFYGGDCLGITLSRSL